VILNTTFYLDQGMRTMIKSPTAFKSEGEVQKTLSCHINVLYDTTDSIFSGIIEPGRTNPALPLVDDPLTTLRSHTASLMAFLYSAEGWRIETAPLFAVFLRALRINDGAAGIKDSQKRLLPAIHTWAWHSLAELLGCVNLTIDISAVLRHFLTRVSIESQVKSAIFAFMGALVWQDAHRTVEGLARSIVDMAIGMLAVKNNNRPTVKRTMRQSKEIHDNLDEEAALLAIRYLSQALRMASFQAQIPPTLRKSLIQALIIAIPKCPDALEALGVAVLNEQPACMSLDLPLFMQILSVAMKEDSTRRIALRMAAEVDFVIRPRRPYAPNMLGRSVDLVNTNAISSLEVEPEIVPSLPPVSITEGMGLATTRMELPDEGQTALPAAPEVKVIERVQSLYQPTQSSPATITPAPSIHVTPAKRAYEFCEDTPLPTLIDEGPDE
jgi:hypothetical protein